MKKIIYIFIFLFISDYMFGQEKKQTIVFINGKESNFDACNKIDPSLINTVEVIKGEKAIKIYGEKAENGVLLVTLKNTLEPKKIEISGVITDCTGPLPGVEIKVLGKTKRIVTDFYGKYKIEAAVGETIIASYPAFKNFSFFIDGNTKTLDIKLEENEFDNKTVSIKVAKPVIYLYPEKEKDVSLKFNFNGKVLTTFPKYEKSWEIKSYPDGKIFDKKTKRFYNSLFWDGERNFDQNELEYKEGFIVERKELTSFLIEKLETIGLNNTETNDFVQYWLPILEQNEFNFIHFKTNEEYNKISENIVHPKPETSIRIMMEFHKTDSNFQIKEQKLTTTKRKGFTLVEWGGAEIPEYLLKKNL